MGSMVDSTEIGKRIRFFRQESRLSQEALAEVVGVSFQQIQKYESGHTTLNVLKLQQIANALNVPISDFFDAHATKNIRLTDEEDQLLQVFRKVKNSEIRVCILKLVGNLNKRMK